MRSKENDALGKNRKVLRKCKLSWFDQAILITYHPNLQSSTESPT